MPYTPELKNLIKDVEKTRPARVDKKKRGEEFTAIPVDERQDILRKFHPDYTKGNKRKITVGPSKGYSISNEIVDLLEANTVTDLQMSHCLPSLHLRYSAILQIVARNAMSSLP